MSYHIVDPIISAWAAEHGLHVSTTYKDEEVRSTEGLFGPKRKYQIWIDRPSADAKIQVHVWDYRKQRQDYSGAVSELYSLLQQALGTAQKWNAEAR